MSKYPFTDKDLKAAAHELIFAIADSAPPASELSHEFSLDFKKKMNLLVARSRKMERRTTTLRAMAAIFILMFLTVTVWLSVDAEARGKVLEWIRETWENGIVYHFDSTARHSDTLPDYEITWLPDGFELVDEYENETLYSAVYENTENGYVMVFDYSIVHDYTNQYVIFEGDTKTESVSINGYEGDYYSDDEANGLVWINDDEAILFSISSNLDKTEILLVARSIEKTQK